MARVSLRGQSARRIGYGLVAESSSSKFARIAHPEMTVPKATAEIMPALPRGL
jgi:hypothetical protein